MLVVLLGPVFVSFVHLCWCFYHRYRFIILDIFSQIVTIYQQLSFKTKNSFLNSKLNFLRILQKILLTSFLKRKRIGKGAKQNFYFSFSTRLHNFLLPKYRFKNKVIIRPIMVTNTRLVWRAMLMQSGFAKDFRILLALVVLVGDTTTHYPLPPYYTIRLQARHLTRNRRRKYTLNKYSCIYNVSPPKSFAICPPITPYDCRCVI